jgi:hypothetical protein
MLRDFQRRFASGLLKREVNGTAPAGLKWNALGYGVHAHNARASLTNAIENAFPVTRRLVGANFFTEMAGQFVTAHPPTHGWLSAYGAEFPDFVFQYKPVAELPYLPGIADLEWARVRAANTFDDPALDLKALAEMDMDDLENLALNLHSAATIIRSSYPVFDIWQAHQHADIDERLARVVLTKAPQSVLVSRPGEMEVGVALLGHGDVVLLDSLKQHSTFGAACRAAVLADMDYDLGSRLGDLVVMRALAPLVDKPARDT